MNWLMVVFAFTDVVLQIVSQGGLALELGGSNERTCAYTCTHLRGMKSVSAVTLSFTVLTDHQTATQACDPECSPCCIEHCHKQTQHPLSFCVGMCVGVFRGGGGGVCGLIRWGRAITYWCTTQDSHCVLENEIRK